jgi:hypothetical protein
MVSFLGEAGVMQVMNAFEQAAIDKRNHSRLQ